MPEQQTRVLAGRYELITPLGRGTMGTVWRAHDRSLGREVAIKEIRQEPGLSEAQRAELRERMIREGRTAARISHPSVATVHDAIIEDGSPWIIMELVQARSLEQVVEEEGPLPPRLVAAIGVDLLDALRAAHAQGVLHRDVKPGNVLITESGRVVLTDFGIAKAEGDTSLTQTGMVIGSPGYTAPERARGEHTGPESDLWSLGATLYFAVEGRPAYERSTMAETLAALMTESVDPPVQAGPLRPVLEQLLEKDHTVRLTPSQAIAMLRAVADTPLASSAPPEAFRPPAPAPAADGGAGSPFHHAAGPGSEGRAGACAGDGAGSGPGNGTGSGPGNGTGPDEEFDANRTMMVARPTIGLPLPGAGRTPPAPPAPRPEAGSGVVAGLGTPVARGPSAPDRRGGPGGPAVPGSGTSAPTGPGSGGPGSAGPGGPPVGGPPASPPGFSGGQGPGAPGTGGWNPPGPPFHGASPAGPGGFAPGDAPTETGALPGPGGLGGPGGPNGPGRPGGPGSFGGAGGFDAPGGPNGPGGPGGPGSPGDRPGPLPQGPGQRWPGDDDSAPGLGTELFSIVGPGEQQVAQQQKKRAGALLLMGVATAALVVIIVLVLALLYAR
ncbi:serine/threonine-protein kinase [Planomonospora sp. ID91781]|uniref:serine/threonine-protein kinase n=1 Tax=Planomonospora sp. ID91781 TaxID=2738135 RepID=UPI0027296DC0|nr:serine/threonine-protein kinase [Planomonospora sp. ID91781]